MILTIIWTIKDVLLLLVLAMDWFFLSAHSYSNKDAEFWFRLWNPATRTISQKFGSHSCPMTSPSFCYAFGCDKTGIYKVVAFCYLHYSSTTEVKVLQLGDDVWRNIESFPIVPHHLNTGENCVYFGGTLNWLAIHGNTLSYNYKDITVEQFVIVSLDLGTETYNQYLPPAGFDQVPLMNPIVGVLGDCLSFSYCYRETHFVIWQMKKFGVEDSWNQFLKISYVNLQVEYDINDNVNKSGFQLVPLLLSEDGDTLVIKCTQEYQAILYNWRHNRVERTKVIPARTITDNQTTDSVWWEDAKKYVESLVPTS